MPWARSFCPFRAYGAKHPPFLQQRRKQSYDTLEQSFQEWAPYEIRHIIHQNTAGFILQINPLDSLSHFLIIEEGIRLEIIFETTEIHIRAVKREDVLLHTP